MRWLASHLLLAGTAGAAGRFNQALRDPAAAQAAVLSRILAANAGSRYGQAHGFGALNDARAFQDRVPVADAESLAPHVAQIMAGETGVLTSEPVLMLEKTSGSTAASKYVPYTNALRREFQAATSAWLHDVYRQRPGLRARGAYWSVSPVARKRETTPGGLSIGFEDDTAYFDPVERWVLRQLLALPGEVARAPDIATCRYVTLRWLAQDGGPGLISVWNPSFLTLLVQAAGLEADRLIHDLRQGTLSPPTPLAPAAQAALQQGLRARPAVADRLQATLGPAGWSGRDLLPNVAFISCWTDAAAALGLPALQALFPGVEVQGKGLLATEGVATFPLLAHAAPLPALTSHFLELRPLDDPAARPLLVHEAEAGGRYELLLTTGGGFYRYALRDVVEVVGHVGRVPLLRFVGKAGLVSDLVGEKLNGVHVGEAIAATLAAAGLTPDFAMLAPRPGATPGYDLFLSGPADVAQDLDARLRANHHYAYARDLGQLGAPTVVVVGPAAAARYVAGCVALGQRAGDVKPTPLHRDAGWRERLAAPSEVPS